MSIRFIDYKDDGSLEVECLGGIAGILWFCPDNKGHKWQFFVNPNWYGFRHIINAGPRFPYYWRSREQAKTDLAKRLDAEVND